MVGRAVSAGSCASHLWFGDSSLYAGAVAQRAICNFRPLEMRRLTIGFPRNTRCFANALMGQLEPPGRCSHA